MWAYIIGDLIGSITGTRRALREHAKQPKPGWYLATMLRSNGTPYSYGPFPQKDAAESWQSGHPIGDGNAVIVEYCSGHADAQERAQKSRQSA